MEGWINRVNEKLFRRIINDSNRSKSQRVEKIQFTQKLNKKQKGKKKSIVRQNNIILDGSLNRFRDIPTPTLKEEKLLETLISSHPSRISYPLYVCLALSILLLPPSKFEASFPAYKVSHRNKAMCKQS